MRAHRLAVVLSTLTFATVMAHAERVAAKRMIRVPRVIDTPFQPTGRPLGAAAVPTGDAATTAYLAGSAIAVAGQRALVIDADSGDLVLVDQAGTPVTRLAIGPTATQLVYDPVARRAYVADRAGDQIVVVEVGDTLRVAARWPTPTEPYGVALSPDRTMLLATTVAARTLVAFDVASGHERWRRPLAPEPRAVAISPDGAQALVTSLTSGAAERITLATPQAGVAISLAPAARATAMVLGQMVPANESGRVVARSAFAARFVGNGLALVAHQTSTPLQDAPFGGNRGSYGGGFEAPIKHALTFVATSQAIPQTMLATIGEHQPKAIAWDPVRDRALVVGYGSDSLLVVAAASQLTVRQERKVGGLGGSTSCGPEGVAVGADGAAWIFCAVSRKVVRVDLEGKVAVGAAEVAPTRMSQLAHAGFDLFRKGGDARISSDGAMACASCHPEAGADGLTWKIEGHELQTPLLAGRVAGTHPYKWDGGDPDLTTSLTSTMRRLGGNGLNAGEVKALAAYLEQLPAPRRPTRDAARVARGRALFESAEVGCASCHDGPSYTDNAQHEFGGTLASADTPSLVGLARSAPYYHDGSAATLEALVAERASVHGMSDSAPLSPSQRADLIAFLETL
ncbi:MAG: c-type cytochrome [Kofleriaceae bacterium]